MQATEAMLAALRGDQDRAGRWPQRPSGGPAGRRAPGTGDGADWPAGCAALGGGRYDEAYEQLRRMHDPADPAYHIALRCYAVADLADAAVHSGQGEAIAGSSGRWRRSPSDPVAVAARRSALRPRGAGRRRRGRGLLRRRPAGGPDGGGRSSGRGPSSPTVSGSGASGARPTPERRCAPPATRSTHSAPFPGASGPARSCGPPARRAAAAPPTHGTSSRRRSSRSPRWPPRD